MANRFWIDNQSSATASSADDDAHWAANSDGSGTKAKPGASDIAIFGHPTTVGANLGFANCSWDITNVGGIVVYDGYKYSTSITKNTISFTASSNYLTLTGGNKWEELGFGVGMFITISGASTGGNNGTGQITAISNNVATVSKSLTTESAAANVTIVNSMCIDVASSFETDFIELNGTLKNSSGSSKVITLDGQFQNGANNRYVLNGDYAEILNQDILTYKYNGIGGSQPSGGDICFDDGPYPNVQIYPALNMACDYKADPTSNNFNAVTMYSFVVTNSSSTLNPGTIDVMKDTSKVFKLLTTSTFAYAPAILDAGYSTWHFKVNASGFVFPIDGITNYGAGDGSFRALWYNVVISTPGTAGFSTTIAAGRTLNLNSLVVEGDAVLAGYSTKGTGETSIITTVSRPNIKGAWNFSQVADGIYSSVVTDTYPITPSHGIGGRVQLSDYAGKFTSDSGLSFVTDTLHVDKGIKITDNADHPTAPGSGYGLIWIRSSDNALIYTNEGGTDTALGSGGGSGDITSVVAGTGLSGGATSGAATLNLAAIADDTILANVSGGSLAPAALNVAGIKTLIGDATTSVHGLMTDTQFDSLAANVSKLSGIEASADVTDTANVTAAGALMDSEVDADIKTLSLPASTTISAYGKTLIDDADAAAARTTLGLGTAATTATGAYATAAQGATADTALQAGMPVSLLLNDAGYLTAATTPTGTWGRWESTANYDNKDENVNHLMLVDDSSNFTKTGTLAGFSSGTFTATAATAGTYIVYVQAQYGIASSTPVPETSGLKYQAQLLIYHGSNMEGFGRYLRNGFWADEHYCTTTVVTLANGEELEVYYKLNDPNTSSAKHFKLKNGGGNPATYVMMVKIA